MGGNPGGTGGTCPPHYFLGGGHHIKCPPHVLSEKEGDQWGDSGFVYCAKGMRVKFSLRVNNGKNCYVLNFSVHSRFWMIGPNAVHSDGIAHYSIGIIHASIMASIAYAK